MWQIATDVDNLSIYQKDLDEINVIGVTDSTYGIISILGKTSASWDLRIHHS